MDQKIRRHQDRQELEGKLQEVMRLCHEKDRTFRHTVYTIQALLNTTLNYPEDEEEFWKKERADRFGSYNPNERRKYNDEE